MKFVIRAYTSDEYSDCNLALVEINKEQAKEIIKSRKLIQEALSIKMPFNDICYFFYNIDFYNIPEIDLDDNTYSPCALLKLISKNAGDSTDSDFRLEMSQICLSQYSVDFIAFIKHTNIHLSTDSISYEKIESILKN